jgi:hypothetical protein
MSIVNGDYQKIACLTPPFIAPTIFNSFQKYIQKAMKINVPPGGMGERGVNMYNKKMKNGGGCGCGKPKK